MALLVLLGAYLRFCGIGRLLLGGDELHALRVASQKGLVAILSHYGPSDNSIFLSLYARALMETVGCDEFRLRLPVMVAGLLLMLSPCLFRRQLGPSGTALAVGLFACSSPLIYFSFVARPYGLAALLVVVALAAWTRWLRTGSPTAGLGFSAAGALAVFLHLFALWPILVLWVLTLPRLRSGRASFRELALMASVFGLLVLVLLGPGAAGLAEHRLTKAWAGRPTPALAAGALQILTGLPPAGTILSIALAGLGFVHWRERHGEFALALAGMVLLSSLALLLTSPFPTAGAWSRYLVPAWPAFLLLAAAGILRASNAVWTGWLRRRTPPPIHALAVTIPAAMVLLLPVGTLDCSLDSFRGRRSTMEPASPLSAALERYGRQVDELYRRIARDPDAGDFVLECPYVTEWRHWDPFVLGQRIHGKRVKMVSTEGADRRHGGLSFENVIDLEDARRLAEAEARYLVVHLDALEALNAKRRRPGQGHRSTTRTLALLQKRYGRPVGGTATVFVFDLGARPQAR